MGRRPYFMFYPGDWLNDSALRIVSPGARGMWIDLICLMAQGDPYGTLTPTHYDQLPRLLGVHHHTCKKLCDELIKAGILRRYPEGNYYCKRMIEDEEKSIKGRYFGKFGGNPALKGDNPTDGSQPKGPPDNQFHNHSQNQKESRGAYRRKNLKGDGNHGGIKPPPGKYDGI